jgi:hypothetical protein
MKINTMIALIRVPYLSEYNLLDVREEPIISTAADYLNYYKIDLKIFDFHLDRSTTMQAIQESQATFFVIGVRGTGLHWKYAERVAIHLLQKTNAMIILYGQTGKLGHWKSPNPKRTKIVLHDEKALAKALGLPVHNFSFTSGLRHYPYGIQYFESMGERTNLFKATIETTRGCHFGCKFCFINHGSNYPKRYQRRSNNDVLADMKTYLKLGISKFWFYDSEFIGRNSFHYPQIKDLLISIRNNLPPVEIMIYSRADMLERFNQYELLAEAGVNSVLVGVESLEEEDLKAMNKGQSTTLIKNAIANLRINKIFCNLSFILFNKTASAKSIRENLNQLINIYRSKEFIYIGQTLYFSYAFESDWSPNLNLQKLSGKTKLGGSTSSTRTYNEGVSFDPLLEPYAEICRIINYEQVRKLCQLNLEKEKKQSDLRKDDVHEWATLLALFTLNLMVISLDEFEAGRLANSSIIEYEAWVYSSYKKFNAMLLPEKWSCTITDKFGYFSGDWNGWEAKIPTPKRLL